MIILIAGCRSDHGGIGPPPDHGGTGPPPRVAHPNAVAARGALCPLTTISVMQADTLERVPLERLKLAEWYMAATRFNGMLQCLGPFLRAKVLEVQPVDLGNHCEIARGMHNEEVRSVSLLGKWS